MKKTITLFLVCVLLLQFFSPFALAATESNAYISMYGAWLSSPSSNSIEIGFFVIGTGVMSSIGASVIYLYEDGSLLAVFPRANPLYTSSMTSTNSSQCYGSITYPANPGSTYYASVLFYATNSNGTGTEGCVTSPYTIPSSPQDE